MTMHQSFEFIEDTHAFGSHMFRKATDIMLQQLREGRVVLEGDVFKHVPSHKMSLRRSCIFDMNAYKQSYAEMVAGDDVEEKVITTPEEPKPFDFNAYNGIKR